MNFIPHPQPYSLMSDKYYDLDNKPTNDLNSLRSYKQRYNSRGSLIYREWNNGRFEYWMRNDLDNIIFYYYNRHWVKYDYDLYGNRIYYECEDGSWWKREYDDAGNALYYEDSTGYWWKKEYNQDGNVIYYEDSSGHIRNNR